MLLWLEDPLRHRCHRWGGGINNSLVVTAASPGAAAGTFSPGTIIPGDVMFVKFKFGVVKAGRFLVLFTSVAAAQVVLCKVRDFAAYEDLLLFFCSK